MAIKTYSIKCPECGANLSVEEGRNHMYCTYCGAEVTVQNENEFIYRTINEADLKNAETDQMVRLKELELQIEEKKYERTKFLVKLCLSIILATVGIVFFFISAHHPEDEGFIYFLVGGAGVTGSVLVWFSHKFIH